MQSTLRSTAAAATVLFAALGALAVATPASAEWRDHLGAQAAPARAHIDRFVVTGAFDRDGDVRFRVQGTPGAGVVVDVPGVTRTALAEVRPGVYEGQYRLRGGDRHAFERAVATLQAGGQRITAVADVSGDRGHAPAQYDNRAPRISDLTPSQGDRVDDRGRTRIGARIHDRGTGIAQVTLRVDGRDVSNRLRIEGGEVRYTEDLPEGRHQAELIVRDRAGNSTREAWNFVVVDRDRDRDHGHGRGRDR